VSRRTLVLGVSVLIGVAVAAALVVSDGNGNGAAGETAGSSASDQWTALQPAQLSRTEVAAARVGRFIYVMGGFEQSSGGTTAATERYDLRRDRWRRVRSMPVGLNHPAAVAYRGRVYVIGGYTGRGDLRGEVASLYRYDPRQDRWSRLPAAPTKRAAHAAGVIGGKLYVAGGANSRDGALATLEIYDFARRRWSRGPNMAKAREHLAGAVAGGAFYVLAGRVTGQGNFKVAERYLPRARRWEQLPDMRKPRGGIGAAAVGRRVVVAGGEEATGTIGEVETYDPVARRWSSLPGMRTPRHGLGVVSRGRRVYTIEGGPTPGFDFSNAIEYLDVK
jgi:non-specific serine/threonine protein kinase